MIHRNERVLRTNQRNDFNFKDIVVKDCDTRVFGA